jgi:hypothetical protein
MNSLYFHILRASYSNSASIFYWHLQVLVFYVFAIVAMIMFRDNDPWHFGSLHVAMLTLFRISTLEDWTDVMCARDHRRV